MFLSRLFCQRHALFQLVDVFPGIHYTQSRTITGSSRKRRIRTLNPRLLDASDVIDLSGMHTPTVSVQGKRMTLTYGLRNRALLEFPQNTRGTLYYHRIPNTPHKSGQIRFRVTPDPFDFSKGADLLIDRGSLSVPWSLSLLPRTKQTSSIYAPLKDLLHAEGLVDDTASDMILMQRSVHPCQQLHYLEQPFVVDLQSTNVTLHIVIPQAFGRVCSTQGFFVDQRLPVRRRWPYSGRVLLRFERLTLPKHNKARIIVVRILKILEPIRVIIPRYDNYLPLPREGELLEMLGKGTSIKHRPFTINLNKAPKSWQDLNLLAPVDLPNPASTS